MRFFVSTYFLLFKYFTPPSERISNKSSTSQVKKKLPHSQKNNNLRMEVHLPPDQPPRHHVLRRHRTNIKAAIIGLPNAGKTGLFTVLTDEKADIDDSVFTSTRANFGVADFHDPRFDWLCGHFDPERAVPARVQVIDCPALVAGAVDGAGRGCWELTEEASKADVILVVVRAFDGNEATQVGDCVNPLRDLETIMAELLVIDKKTVAMEHGPLLALQEKKQGGSQLDVEVASLSKVKDYLDKVHAVPLRLKEDWEDQDVAMVRRFNFLTDKEVVIVVNMCARDYLRPPEAHESPTGILGRVRALVADRPWGDPLVVAYSGEFEFRVRDLRTAASGIVGPPRPHGSHHGHDAGEEAVADYFAANPTHTSARGSIMRHAFWALKLVHFFTVGPEEVRTWTLPRGACAPAAAGTVHRDFEEGFLSVDVESFMDLHELGSEVEVKRHGKIQQQGIKYVVQDGDICFFRFKLPNYKAWRG